MKFQNNLQIACLALGERPYIHQEIQSVQYGAIIGQVNMAHQPPTVSF